MNVYPLVTLDKSNLFRFWQILHLNHFAGQIRGYIDNRNQFLSFGGEGALIL